MPELRHHFFFGCSMPMGHDHQKLIITEQPVVHIKFAGDPAGDGFVCVGCEHRCCTRDELVAEFAKMVDQSLKMKDDFNRAMADATATAKLGKKEA